MGLKDKSLLDKVNALIGPESALGASVEDLSRAFKEQMKPDDSAHAEVVFFGKQPMQVLWTIQTTGAYTTTNRVTVIADLEKGVSHGPESMFEDDLKVARYVHSKMEPTMQAVLQNLDKAHPTIVDPLTSLNIPLPYGPDDLFNLQLGDLGIRFYYTYKFPHSYGSLEPYPIFIDISWSGIKPFLI